MSVLQCYDVIPLLSTGQNGITLHSTHSANLSAPTASLPEIATASCLKTGNVRLAVVAMRTGGFGRAPSTKTGLIGGTQVSAAAAMAGLTCAQSTTAGSREAALRARTIGLAHQGIDSSKHSDA